MEIEEAVFMQSYIPTSLQDLANPYMEADRLRTGQREPSFQAAVNKMLGGATKAQASSSRGAHGKATAARGLSEGNRIIRADVSDDSDEDDDSENDAERGGDNGPERMDMNGCKEFLFLLYNFLFFHYTNNFSVDASDDAASDSEDEDNEDDMDMVESTKYRKQLPSREDPEQRRREKEARKEARKQSKAEKAEKRQHKIPKHLKKKAVKAGKK